MTGATSVVQGATKMAHHCTARGSKHDTNCTDRSSTDSTVLFL